MIVREPDNLCVVCGSIIPEGRQVCPICGTKDDAESFAQLIRSDTSKPELMVDGLAEQTFREGYIKGFNEGMKAACELKQQNTQLRKDNAILRAAIERRDSEENKDGWYE